MPSNDPNHCIRVRGAREHNLRALSVDIPRDRLVVITGVSGSGKSSLAFDTIFAEGQRKYMESLSAYARQFLDQMKKPDIESVDGLPPTIAIEQRSGGHSPRSTVATTTEIYDYFRLLWARCGAPTCWHRDESGHVCGNPITATAPSQIVESVLATSAGKRLMVCAPLVRARKGFHKEILEQMVRAGLVRARVNGTIVELRDAQKRGGENPFGLGRYEAHTIDAVVDRIVASVDDRQRLSESIETALKAGGGNLLLLVDDGAGGWSEHRFSEHFSCPDHPECSLEELEPRVFSFNSPQGACEACAGLGTIDQFDEDLVVPDQAKPVAEAIEPFRKNGRRMNIWYARRIRMWCSDEGVNPATPFSKLATKARRSLMHGQEDGWEGVLPHLRRRFTETDSEFVKERLHAYMSTAACPSCAGRRLKPSSLGVMVAGADRRLDIASATNLSIGAAREFFGGLKLGPSQAAIAAPIIKEIAARLGFLESVGLGYLTLDRTSSTLSGGEAQRIRLATQVGSGLVGVAYVLDEPTIGLHQRDNDRLVATLRRLSDIGNSVLVVEHDEDMIRAADHVLDIGPGPGRHGGTVVAQGSIAEICDTPGSLTGDYLSGRVRIEIPAERRPLSAKQSIVVKGARENNLKGIDVAFPLGGIVCVTGVSGSGKSTLVNEILLKAAKRHVTGTRDLPGAHDTVTGLGKVMRVVEVDQSPIGRTPRSNPATYTGIFDEIRSVYARMPEAKIRGYEPGRFSFNVKGGRCEVCAGQGVRRIEMHFLPDVFVTCEACKGRRYGRETLEVLCKGKSIADVLDMTVDDATSFFDAHPKIARMLQCIKDVGLGYMQLGQASTTMSGGEAQRVKLASELGMTSAGHTLYVLDEPTTGLHFADVHRLLGVLQRLAGNGHTLVVIEHNLDVIKCADWIVDLGPEGGDGGGTLVAHGTPEAVAATPGSFTGEYLARMLGSIHPAAPASTTAKPARAKPASAKPASEKKPAARKRATT